MSHNVSCVVFVLDKGVMQPDELFMLSDDGELVLLEVGERALDVRVDTRTKISQPIRSSLCACLRRRRGEADLGVDGKLDLVPLTQSV